MQTPTNPFGVETFNECTVQLKKLCEIDESLEDEKDRGMFIRCR